MAARLPGLSDSDYPLHDKTIVVTLAVASGWASIKMDFSQVFAAQAIGIKRSSRGDLRIWLVSFVDYDPGYIDLEEKTLQPLKSSIATRSAGCKA